jgi:hypothetical protein
VVVKKLNLKKFKTSPGPVTCAAMAAAAAARRPGVGRHLKRRGKDYDVLYTVTSFALV